MILLFFIFDRVYSSYFELKELFNMEKTNQELYEIMQAQQAQIDTLIKDLKELKRQSDLNDNQLYEIVNSLTDCVDKLLGI